MLIYPKAGRLWGQALWSKGISTNVRIKFPYMIGRVVSLYLHEGRDNNAHFLSVHSLRWRGNLVKQPSKECISSPSHCFASHIQRRSTCIRIKNFLLCKFQATPCIECNEFLIADPQGEVHEWGIVTGIQFLQHEGTTLLKILLGEILFYCIFSVFFLVVVTDISPWSLFSASHRWLLWIESQSPS